MLVTPSSDKPRVILGCMTFGPPGTEDKGARVTSLGEYKECLNCLQQSGYNELDTARVYIGGEQEGFTAEAGYSDRGFTIATKVYPYEAGIHTPERLKEHFNTSLAALKTNCVDIFYLHAPNRAVPFEDTLKACNELFQEGKFVKLGLSNFAAWEVAEVVNIARERGWVQPTIYQAMYNAITRAIESELIPCCRKYGIDIVIYNPLAGGIFSGKYSTSDLSSTPEGGGRFSATNQRQGQTYRNRYFKDATFEALAAIEPVVKNHNLTLIETALRWCIHHSQLKMGTSTGPTQNASNTGSMGSGNSSTNNDGIIIGVSSLKQLQSNLADLEKGPLPDEVVRALDLGWQIAKATADTYWR